MFDVLWSFIKYLQHVLSFDCGIALFLPSVPPCLNVFYPLFVTSCDCFVDLIPCHWQMNSSFHCINAVSASCHFRWWTGWCHVNDWRQWSPHTSCCSCCAPCWSWALFTTPLESYISTFGARSHVSDVHCLINTCSITYYHLPQHTSCFKVFDLVYFMAYISLASVCFAVCLHVLIVITRLSILKCDFCIVSLLQG